MPKSPSTSTAPKATRAAKDPAAPALAAVKKAQSEYDRVVSRVEKARLNAEKQAQAAQAAQEKAVQAQQTSQDALAQVEAERIRAEQVLAYAQAHPLLQGGTLDEAAAQQPAEPAADQPAAQ